MIKAIETEYNGYRFRSRLEARWAVFFDSLKIPYIYEPEGLSINGECYLPDFYLPDCNQFFEVKGVMDERSSEKIHALIKAGYSVTVGFDNGRFTACDLWQDEFLLTTDDSWLCRCHSCEKYWFVGDLGSWACQCCDYYDGDSGFDVVMQSSKYYSDLDMWDVAKRARFEFNK